MSWKINESGDPALPEPPARQRGEACGGQPLKITLRSLEPARMPGDPAPPVSTPARAPARGATDWLDTFIDELIDAQPSAPALLRSPSTTPPPGTDFAELSIGHAASQVLGQVLLGYSPVIDPVKGVIATRLTVVPLRAAMSIDVGALLETIAEVWPADGDPMMLNLGSESLLADVLRARPSVNLMIEVPAFIAADPANSAALLDLAARGNALLLKGRPLRELPRQVLPCFRWSIIDRFEDRRDRAAEPQGAARTIAFIQSGVRTMAEMRDSFARGAAAVLGWPLSEPICAAFEAHPDTRVVLDALQCLERDDPPQPIDHVLMRDPVLALELLRLINAEAGGLSVEAGSIEHAVSMLGAAQLRRWLGRLLGRARDDHALRPAAFAALRRGLLMRMLAAGTGEREQRGELFMCGVLSLLHRIYARPIVELLHPLPLPERVRAALIDRSGPYMPLLALARAIESELPHDIRAASEAAFMPPLEINRALLRSLLVASHLEGPAAAPGAPARKGPSWPVTR